MLHQDIRPWLISTVAPRPNIVPKAQPDISQTRSVWYRGKMKIRPEGTGGKLSAYKIFAGQTSRMPSTHLSLHFHIVFSTKDRHPFIA